jgi:tRNA G18 (ribose-2'-O)-methylase SpoU
MIIAVLDNIRSAHNVGSIFRTADAFGISELYLCGTTPAPKDKFGRARSDIGKVALGAEKTVAWKYYSTTRRAVSALKKKGFKIFSVEQDKKSEKTDILRTVKAKNIALVFGNEVDGVNPKILKISDKIIEIPMFGKKESLNVSVAFGIVSHELASLDG